MLCLHCFQAFTQAKILRGRITDISTNQPLEGVSVKIKNSATGSLSAADGSFQLSVSPGDKLVISYVGYGEQTVGVQNVSSLDIRLTNMATELTAVVMVGNRGTARTKTDSPVPVDIINVNSTAQTTAKPDLMSQLNMSVPSFNYNKQSGGDGSDAIDFASLRGLGFDQTLVLVNGKRRHLSAFVNQVGTRGRGNSGTDLNAIPEASIDRIEILRDGASAQYGSDAIAGVVNIILKKNVRKLSVNLGGSGFYDRTYNTLNSVDPSQYYTGSWLDGKTIIAGVNYGLPVGKNGGYINISGNFMNQGKTFRAVPDTNWSTNAKALSVNDWRRAAGDGSVVSGGGVYNMEIPLKGTKTSFYSFGGYNYKHSNVYAWTRRWHTASNRVKFPTDANGNLIFVPGIMRVFGQSHAALDTNNVYYNPQEDVYIKDASIAAGFRGTWGSGWDWDVSNVTGYNDFHYFGNKTFNSSLPLPQQATKNRFDDGGFNFLQSSTNFDVSRHFKGIGSGLSLSFGAEFRYERYKLYAGEPDSYRNGGATLLGVLKASGSEGYPGYQPTDATSAHRTNKSAYAEIAFDVTDRWLVDLAERFEDYSDFGFVSTQKLASRYKLTNNLKLRGSISSGFRAPSLQQINFSNTNTNIIGGQLVYAKLIPNYSGAARAVGIPSLVPETSVNGSLGFSWNPVHNLTVTLDGYLIQIKNRIVITGNFDTAIAVLKPYLLAANASTANFFVNAVNTTNTGVDLVVDYTKRWKGQRFTALLAGNLQHIAINKINIPDAFTDTYARRQAFFSTREETFLKASAPKAKGSLGLEYSVNKFAAGTHITYFGKIVTQGFGYASVPGAAAGGPGGAGISDAGNGWDPHVLSDDGRTVLPENFIFNSKAVTDIYASYRISKTVSWFAGVDNLFNVHPDLAVTKGAVKSSWGDSESGGPFDAVQMGSNGLRVFTRIALNF